MKRLVFVTSEGRRVPIRAGLVVGRDPSCGLTVNAPRVSRQHFAIEDAGTSWVLRDLASRNGTRLNGQRVQVGVLAAGDRVEVGDAVLVVEVAADDEVAAPNAECPETMLELARNEAQFSVDPLQWAETETPGRRLSVPPLLSWLEALFRMSQLTAQAESVGDLARGLVEIAMRMFQGHEVLLLLDSSNGLQPASSWGSSPSSPSPSGLLTWARRAWDRDVSCAMRDPVTNCDVYLAILRTRTARLGVVGVTTARRATLTRDALEVLMALSHQAALGIETLHQRDRLAVENDELRRSLPRVHSIVGRSGAAARLREDVARFAPTQSVVLVLGESGVGKEVVARAIHAASRRSGGPLVAVNCGALNEQLLTSELFGHERGAFTGADRRKIGLFERAHGGTLFLDEVAELSVEAQARLLRVLETLRVVRVGGTEEVPVDVRVVAATHRRLEDRVREGRFREDLFYRLNVLPVEVPPLRDRIEDIPDLAAALLPEIAHRIGRPVPQLSSSAIGVLQRHDWPGNVRELRNVLERASILREGDRIDAEHIAIIGPSRPVELAGRPLASLAELEAAHIRGVLERVRWNKTRAAEILGITRQTVHEKIRQYGLERS